MADFKRDDSEQSGMENKDSERGEGKGGRRSFHRKKVCRFCADTEFVMDYKDARMMSSFQMELGKIVPRRISGTCAFHQRKLTVALKRARILALTGFVSSGSGEGGHHREGGHRDREGGGYHREHRGEGGGYRDREHRDHR